MASAIRVAGVRATLDLGSKISKRVQRGEPESARITHQPEVGHGGQVDGKHANRGVPGGKTRRSRDGDLGGPIWLANSKAVSGQSMGKPTEQ